MRIKWSQHQSSCMSNQELIQGLKNSGALKFGEFELSSGGTSDYYIDKYEFETDPATLKMIAKRFSSLLGDEKIAGVALGAVPLVTATSLKAEKSYIIIRKEEKNHGTGNKVEGNIKKGEKITVIEDVTTTGKTALRSVETIRELGGVVDKVLVVVNRQQSARDLLSEHDIDLEALIEADELLSDKQK